MKRDTSTKVQAQLIDQLQRAGAKLDPSAVAALGSPLRARTTDIVPISDRSGRGLAPFYFALMMTLAGFAATFLSILFLLNLLLATFNLLPVPPLDGRNVITLHAP